MGKQVNPQHTIYISDKIPERIEAVLQENSPAVIVIVLDEQNAMIEVYPIDSNTKDKPYWLLQVIQSVISDISKIEITNARFVLSNKKIYSSLTNPANTDVSAKEREYRLQVFQALQKFDTFSIEYGEIPEVFAGIAALGLAPANNIEIEVAVDPNAKSTLSRFDYYFMRIAILASSLGSCDRAHVGCVLTRENRLIATGFNGSVSGTEHCDEIGHLMVEGHCVRTIHAEMNAVLQCAIYGPSCQGATAYVTHFPCLHCMKALLQAGITKIFYNQPYRPDKNTMNLLREKGAKVIQIDVTADEHWK